MLELLLDLVYWYLVIFLAVILAGAWKSLWTLRRHQEGEES